MIVSWYQVKEKRKFSLPIIKRVPVSHRLQQDDDYSLEIPFTALLELWFHAWDYSNRTFPSIKDKTNALLSVGCAFLLLWCAFSPIKIWCFYGSSNPSLSLLLLALLLLLFYLAFSFLLCLTHLKCNFLWGNNKNQIQQAEQIGVIWIHVLTAWQKVGFKNS